MDFLAACLKAASELQKYLEKISGIKINITDDAAKMKPCEFVIGHSKHIPNGILAMVENPGSL